MMRADWGDENGSTVTFKLPMNDAGIEDLRNPFHDYTKRRKGHAGTRFMMACQTDSEGIRHVLYEDQVMLAGWNDSQQNGHTVKLWLCNDGMGHPFEGVSRTQVMLIGLQEIDDDEEVIDQKMRERVEKQEVIPTSRLSYVAAMLCKNPVFWEFINEETEQSGDFLTKGVTDELGAKEWIYQKCGIRSRAELDVGGQAAVTFDGIRKAFTAVLEVC
jgi:hypothetical protein